MVKKRQPKQPKFPAFTVVHNARWNISWKPNLKDHDGRPCLGLCNYDTQTIYLNSCIRGTAAAWTTLEHEEGHAAIFSTGFYRILEVQIKDDSVRLFIEDQWIDNVVPALRQIDRRASR